MYFFNFLLLVLPFALAEKLVIPQVQSVVAAQVRTFADYVHYDGPTGTASAELAGASALIKPIVKSKLLSTPYWYEQITHRGVPAFNGNSSYQVYRNVKDYGAKGDGVTDDTAAINRAISDGGRCAPGQCQSQTYSAAVVYFPAGTYMISASIIDYYYTQLIGNPNNLPVIKALPSFSGGLGMIDGNQYQAGGVLGYSPSTNVFWRQIRNLVIDSTLVPASSAITGIHWPTAQATSLQNVWFRMSDAPGTQHQGLFMEEGSGGFMNDLVFFGGKYGMNMGNQQFTMRNLTFYNAATAINQFWNWGWTFKSLNVVNCTVGYDMTNAQANPLTVGSATFLDSSFTNVRVAINTTRGTDSNTNPQTAGSLALENIVLNNVGIAVKYGPTGATQLAGGTRTITGWASGHQYAPTGPTNIQATVTPLARPASLLSGSKYYERSKPQYESLAYTSFSSVKAGGARGDGVTDDTAAIQSVINAAKSAGRVVYFDHGTYKVTRTIYIPSGSKIVGEAYAVIMSSGSFFSNINAPQVVVQVGNAGETGAVEWSDMIVSTQGAQAGAILIKWNLAASSSAPSGMWDVHTRVGGFRGSNLQLANCPTTPSSTTINQNCIAAYMSMHVSTSASGLYMENVWLWIADHDVEDPNLTQITVYAGRGLYVESKSGTVWLVGTAVEHHQRYQYQFANTANIFMGQIQTETPYYQPNPNARSPFPMNATLNDPNYDTSCPSGTTGNCAAAWGLRVLACTNLHVYGAGLYSFFSNYSTSCSAKGAGATCQTSIFQYDSAKTTGLYVYNLNTIGATGMVHRDTTRLATYSFNINVFPSTIVLFRSS